jgi:3-oxoacyl-[acyl-carrier protein] reductase
MDLGLNGRTALVLGGNRGMGLAIAHALAREGADVAIAARDPAALAAARNELLVHGGRVAAFPLDLSATASLPEFAARMAGEFAAPDILINNTGGPPYGGAAGRAAADWTVSFQDMTLSVIALTDAFLPSMRAKGWGRIVTIVSSGAVQPIPVLGISNTLRAALVAWSKTLSNEIAADGVTANILVPGRIATDRVTLTDEAVAAREGISVDVVRARSFAAIPMGRYGKPEEIADMVAFLASARAGYITGASIRVDGGIIRHV